jgi:uncharacterized membrane protein YheB (UPF0754 family)
MKNADDTPSLPPASQPPRPEKKLGEVLQDQLAKHFQFSEVFTPKSDGKPTPKSAKGASKAFQWFVAFLKVSPWLCLAAFIVSFFIDFGQQDGFNVLGHWISLESLVRIIGVSGLIGFFTNWLAIKMLFKPVIRRPIWGQGLIPAQRDIIIAQLAGGIHKNILSEELIAQRIEKSGIIGRLNQLLVKGSHDLLADAEFSKELRNFVYWYLKDFLDRQDIQQNLTQKIDEKLEQKLNAGLKGFIFRTYRNLNPSDYQAVLSGFITNIPESTVEILEELEGKTEDLGKYLASKAPEIEQFFTKVVMDVLGRINIFELLKTQMEHFDEAKLERLIWTSTSNQLLYIQYLGTILGMLGGLLIWQPIPILVVYLSLFGTLFLLDQFLYRLKSKTT